MITYTPEKKSWMSPEEEAAQPIVAIGYEKDGKSWRVNWASTAKTELDFTHCLDGMTEFTDYSGDSHYEAETGTLSLSDWQPQKVWLDRKAVKVIQLDGVVVNRSQLAEHGITVITKPLTEEDPTADAHHADTCHTEYCRICRGHWMEEPGCWHLGWAEGGGGWVYGCGAEDVDVKEAKRSIFDLLDLIPRPLVGHWRDLMAAGKFELQAGNDWRSNMAVVVGNPKAKSRLFEETLDADYLETLCGADEGKAQRIFWPGLAWLRSLDKETPHYTALTQGWLHEYLKGHERRSMAFVPLPDKRVMVPYQVMEIKRADKKSREPAYPVHLYARRGNGRSEIWRIDPGTFVTSAKAVKWQVLYPLLKHEGDSSVEPWELPGYSLLPLDVIAEWKGRRVD